MIIRNTYNSFIPASNTTVFPLKTLDGSVVTRHCLPDFLSNNSGKFGLAVFTSEQNITYTMHNGVNGRYAVGTGGGASFFLSDDHSTIMQTVRWSNTGSSDVEVKAVGHLSNDQSGSTVYNTNVILVCIINLAEPIIVTPGSTLAVTFKYTVG